MDVKFLEKYFETVVLPLYAETRTFEDIVWKDHGKVGLDTWAHYFDDKTGREHVLIYEDFPGSEYMNDDLSHIVVPCGGETSVCVSVEPGRKVENIFGYFSLYEKKSS